MDAEEKTGRSNHTRQLLPVLVEFGELAVQLANCVEQRPHQVRRGDYRTIAVDSSQFSIELFECDGVRLDEVRQTLTDGSIGFLSGERRAILCDGERAKTQCGAMHAKLREK